MNSRKLNILLSGGGTGGHIFPAVAIADGLKQRFPDANFLFVGAKGRMEMEKVPQAGYEITDLWISGFQRKLDKRNLSFPFKLISSILKARKIVRTFKPDIVIGTGGYASGPVLYVATKKAIPTLILEQNSFPGVTNRLLAKSVDVICVATPGMEKYFPKEKLIITGSPIRKQITNQNINKKEANEFFEIKNDSPNLLVIGGSQGALGINEAIVANLNAIAEMGINLIWQTGINYFEKASQLVAENELSHQIKIHKFIRRMDMAYAQADFVVSRSGAIALAEIVQCEKPCVFIPLPTAAEDHQTKNALSLADENAAVLLPQKDAKQNLIKLLQTNMLDDNKRKELSENIKKFKTTDATDNIVNQAVKLLK